MILRMNCPFYKSECKETACNGESEFITDSGKILCNVYADNEPSIWRTDLMPPERPVTKHKNLVTHLD